MTKKYKLSDPLKQAKKEIRTEFDYSNIKYDEETGNWEINESGIEQLHYLTEIDYNSINLYCGAISIAQDGGAYIKDPEHYLNFFLARFGFKKFDFKKYLPNNQG